VAAGVSAVDNARTEGATRRTAHRVCHVLSILSAYHVRWFKPSSNYKTYIHNLKRIVDGH
jgi:hypothetical protein